MLPLASLQALWQIPRASSPSQGLVLAHGELVIQSAGLDTLALIGPLRTTPLADAWRSPEHQQSPRDGVCVIVLTEAATASNTATRSMPAIAHSQPTLPSAEDWLMFHAPAWRLCSRALRPALVLLWASREGAGFLAWRSPSGIWAPIAWLELPGSGLQRVRMHLPLNSATAAPSALDLPGDEGAANTDRYSRPRVALGAPVLHTLQTRSSVFIGLGRTGAPMLHSAVRMGLPVLGLDPDGVEVHNLDGEFSPLHEGWSKAAALRKQLTPLGRPGASLDLRCLDVASPAAGALIAACDGPLLTSVDNGRALLWANAWALALHKVHIVVASGISGPGGLAEAEIRVLLPGQGCLLCFGGFAQPLAHLLDAVAQPHAQRAGGFENERPGSLRSWSVVAGHHALRMLELVASGRVRHSLFRRLTEQTDGGLHVEDRSVSRPSMQPVIQDVRPKAHSMTANSCPMCRLLQGAGLQAVTMQRLQQALAHIDESSKAP